MLLSIVALVWILAGGFMLYRSSMPEYALAETIKDVNRSGMSGLKPHLTRDALLSVETVEGLSGLPDLISLPAAAMKNIAVSYLKSEMANVEWTVEDVVRGSKESRAVIGFNYRDNLVGTIDVLMIKDGRTWLIDQVSFPTFTEISLK